MLYWASLLHFYQPPVQTHEWLARIATECYRPVLDVFLRHDTARASFNINGVLIDLLAQHGLGDVIEQLQTLVSRGQVEITGSGKFHPLLPLLPSAEQTRQIELDQQTKRQVFGAEWRARGFFPPELAYSADCLPPIERSGHDWVLLAGVAHVGEWPTRQIDQIAGENRPLAAFYRDDILSNQISFKTIDAAQFLANLQSRAPQSGNAYVITAMDAETFGHHIAGWERDFLDVVFARLAGAEPASTTTARAAAVGAGGDSSVAVLERPAAPARPTIRTAQLSDLLTLFPAGPTVAPRASSWSTSDADLAANVPFPLWQAPSNRIHRAQWTHLGIAIDLVARAQEAADSEASQRFAALARETLDRAEHSCQMWWASRQPMWDPTLIYRGLALQDETIVHAYRAIDASALTATRKHAAYQQVVVARDLRARIIDRFFETH